MPTMSVWVECLHGNCTPCKLCPCVQPPLQHIVTCMHMQEVWPKMYPPKACAALCKAVQHQHKLLVQQYEDGLAVLPLIEAQVVSAAYRGPEASVIPQLILPLLRQRIETRAAEVKLILKSCCNCLFTAYAIASCGQMLSSHAIVVKDFFCCQSLDRSQCTTSA